MKYRSRMHFYLADQEARLVDPEAVALLLDLDGNVTETSGANFLIVENGAIVSPTTVNTLPGISRAMVIELAAKLGIPFIERVTSLQRHECRRGHAHLDAILRDAGHQDQWRGNRRRQTGTHLAYVC